MANCDNKNPLSRNGSSQTGRTRAALDPSYFKVDERDTGDLLLIAKRYSEHIRYYNGQNVADGDWVPFFSTDLSVILAGLSGIPHVSFLKLFQGAVDFIADDESRSESDLTNHFKLLFHLPVVLLEEVGRFYEKLDWQHPLRGFIDKLVVRDIETPLTQVVAYYKGVLVLDDPPINESQFFEDTALVMSDYNTTFDAADPNIQLPSVVTERVRQRPELSAVEVNPDFIASFAPAGWATWFTTVTPDSNPYVDSAGLATHAVYHQIYDALNYSLLRTAFDKLFQAVERIALEAERYFTESIESFDGHTPHYGLWLSFLKLFSTNQDDANGLTERHLEHYYEEVLQLCRQDPRPDQVHLLFELSKNIEEHLLEAGTRFKAGKDDLGKPVAYTLDNDLVINRGAIAELMSLYQPSIQAGGVDFPVPTASPVTNSADGLGEDLPKEDPKWPVFGSFSGVPDARLGFAISDRQLFMREGTRYVSLIVENGTNVASALIPFAFKISLTTEDGWFETAEITKTLAFSIAPNLLILLVALDGEDPAVIPYDADIHGEGFDTPDPVMKVEFAFGVNPVSTFFSTLAYGLMRNVTFNELRLQVYTTGVRNLVLRNEFGDLDPSKPFQPFGPRPTVGTPLVVGSSEMFSKKLETIQFKIDWAEKLDTTSFYTTASPSTFTATPGHLKGGKWKPLGGSSVALFASGTAHKDVTLSDLDGLSSATPQTLENPPFDRNSAAGFVRLKLDKALGHADYPSAYTIALIETADDPDNAPPLPKEPYTPKIAEFSADYLTKAGAPTSFLHLTPFGFRDVTAATGRLFPEFANEGELYIGVENLDPPQRLTLLFQTVDGTANPLKGETEIKWHYLRGDDWVEFAQQDVDDKTFSLTGSGVIGLAVPAEADTDHSVLPDGLHWFRMSVASDSDAVNNLLDIHTQAATASFSDQDNDPAFVETALAPGTISKLESARSALKSIVQPYASFGGRGPESDEGYYRRVSERLRHKDRAITMWDFEQLVLQEFPDVYKAKCINHTQLVRNDKNEIIADNELKPGHVVVVTIPFVSEESEVDPLRPYTRKSTLIAIDKHLRSRTSPFVVLEVQNPRIEEVQVEFSVAFTDDIADIAFYTAELNEAIIRFLTPWTWDGSAEVAFGGKWHKSAIINFVEEQPYVDFVKDFRMYHKSDISISDASWSKVDEELVEATTARSILVSHASHKIAEIV